LRFIGAISTSTYNTPDRQESHRHASPSPGIAQQEMDYLYRDPSHVKKYLSLRPDVWAPEIHRIVKQPQNFNLMMTLGREPTDGAPAAPSI